MDIKKLITTLDLAYRGVNKTNNTEFLKGITVACDLQNDSEWIKHCMKLDPRHCSEYLTLSKEDELYANGKLLLQFPADKVTLPLLERALNAEAPLTPNMIAGNKVLKNIITNELIIQKAKFSSYEYETGSFYEYYSFDWLKLWNKKGKSFSELTGITDLPGMYKALSMHHILDTRPSTPIPIKVTSTLSKLQLPDSLFSIMEEIRARRAVYEKVTEDFYKKRSSLPWSARDSIKREYIPISDNPEEDTLFLAMLRMSGGLNRYMENDIWKSSTAYVKACIYVLTQQR
jgi:hypothetical protein